MVSKYDVVVSTESNFISIRNFGDDLFTPISNSQHDLSIKIKCERLKEIAYPSIVIYFKVFRLICDSCELI